MTKLILIVSLKNLENEMQFKWPRSPIEKLEEWLFKIRRTYPIGVFKTAMTEVVQFKGAVKSMECPNCKGKLVLSKFERGPKGWEADVKCETCNFTGVISSLCAKLMSLDSKGQARDAT